MIFIEFELLVISIRSILAKRATNLENACPPSCDDPHVTIIAI